MEFLSTSIIELLNIDGSSHEESIVIFIINKDLNMTETNYVTEDDDGNCFELSYSEKRIYNDPNIFMVYWWVTNWYFNDKKIKIRDI